MEGKYKTGLKLSIGTIFEWSWVTSKTDFKVMLLLNVK